MVTRAAVPPCHGNSIPLFLGFWLKMGNRKKAGTKGHTHELCNSQIILYLSITFSAITINLTSTLTIVTNQKSSDILMKSIE